MSVLPPDVDRALYRELVPIRPTPPSGCHMGPTEQFRILEAQRAAWRLAHPEPIEQVAS